MTFQNSKGHSKTEYCLDPIIALFGHLVPKSVEKSIRYIKMVVAFLNILWPSQNKSTLLYWDLTLKAEA